MIKSILRLPLAVINWFILNLTHSQYRKFPVINGILWRRGRGDLKMGQGVKINSSFLANPVGMASRTCLVILPGASIEIGDDVGISNSLLYARERIEIEDDVLIGGGCQLWDNDFHSLDFEARQQNPDPDIQSAPIKLKRGCFIGANSILLKGITVGQFAIVAAGSVVTRSIPDHEVWGGNPARLIRSAKS